MTLEEVKEKLRRRLIDNDGNVAPHNLVDIIDDAKSAGLGERDIARLLPEIDQSINWAAIKKEKQAAQEAAAQREEAKKRAVELINTMIGLLFADGILEQSELAAIFDKASSLKITDHSIAKKIYSRIEKGGYKPFPNVDLKAGRLRDILLSTSWYDDSNYARVLAAQRVSTSQRQKEAEEKEQELQRQEENRERVKKKMSPASLAFLIFMSVTAIVFAVKSWYDYAREAGKRKEIHVTANNETTLQNAETLTQTEREKIVATLKTLYEVPAAPVSDDYMFRFQNLFNEHTAHYYGATNISRKKIAALKRRFWNNVSGYGIDNLLFVFMGRAENYGYNIRVSGTVRDTAQKTSQFNSSNFMDIVTLDRNFRVSTVIALGK